VKKIHIALYYLLLQYLPVGKSYNRFSKIWWIIRGIACKKIFKYCGKNVHIQRKAYFGSGKEVEIGDNSGLGINCEVPSNIKIGKNVLMGPNCVVLNGNHEFKDNDIPIIEQGMRPSRRTIIEDNVWIGYGVIITPGRILKKGTIVAAGAVVTKDFPEFSIIGGNPAKIIRMRK